MQPDSSSLGAAPDSDRTDNGSMRQSLSVVFVGIVVLLATLHSFVIVRDALIDFLENTRLYPAAKTDVWNQLFETSKQQSYLLVLIATPLSVISMWFVKTCVLWCLSVVIEGEIPFRRAAALMGDSYLPFVAFHLVGLILLWVIPVKGQVGWLDSSDVGASFAAAVTQHFASMGSNLAMRLTDGGRISAELFSYAIIVYKLDDTKLVGWRRGLVIVTVIACVVHFISLWRLVSNIASISL